MPSRRNSQRDEDDRHDQHRTDEVGDALEVAPLALTETDDVMVQIVHGGAHGPMLGESTLRAKWCLANASAAGDVTTSTTAVAEGAVSDSAS